MDMLDNYGIEKEKKLSKKQTLLDETIKEKKLSKYEIIKKMYESLLNEMDDLKKILFEDLSVTEKAKAKAERISKIAFTLQSVLDMDNGKEISEQLTWLYRFIRYATKRIQDNEDVNFVQPAYKIVQSLNEAWAGIPSQNRF
jgi:flagellin-specific chaperone FliS